MRLYHYQLGLPNANYHRSKFPLSYTAHARFELKKDFFKYGLSRSLMPKAISPNISKIIEVGIKENGELGKILYRVPVNQDYDICLVVKIPSGVVKTAWINHKADTHSTLQIEKYTVL